MTNRSPETAVLITAEKLNAMADSIAKSIEVFREAAEIAHTNKGLATFSVKSGEAAVERSHSFARALEKAIYAAKSNQPFVVGELKPRSTAKKLPTPTEAKTKGDAVFGKRKKKGKAE